ncbi:MAG: SHOCT domain-containing protein [archaeon]
MSEKRDLSWIVLLFAVVLIVAFGSFTMMGPGGIGSGMMRGWGMGPGMMGFGFAWPFMFLVPVLFVILVILGLYYLLSGHSSSRYEENAALRTLKERYARGEITSEQYAKMKRDLES